MLSFEPICTSFPLVNPWSFLTKFFTEIGHKIFSDRNSTSQGNTIPTQPGMPSRMTWFAYFDCHWWSQRSVHQISPSIPVFSSWNTSKVFWVPPSWSKTKVRLLNAQFPWSVGHLAHLLARYTLQLATNLISQLSSMKCGPPLSMFRPSCQCQVRAAMKTQR